MRSTFILFFCIISLGLWAGPTVPTKIDFAGMRLSLDAGARAKIKSDVDRLTRSPRYVEEVVRKADVFFPVIEKMFRQTNFPDDIKYLCIQESGFKADAVSSSNAVGYWQFKKPTAQEVGLQVSKGIDERKNIAAASLGAARYMTQNNKKLDNWVYALTAYNTGLGGVQKFVQKKYLGQSKMNITAKTHWYFLKFLAHKIAYQDLVGKNKKPQTTLQLVTNAKGKNILQVGKKYQVLPDEMKKYNLWIGSHSKIPAGKTYYVVVPTSKKIKLDPEIKPYAKNETKENTQAKNTNPSKNESEKPVKHSKKHAEKEENPAIYGDGTVELGPPSFVKVNKVRAIKAQNGDNLHSLAHQGGITRDKLAKLNEVGIYHQVVPGKMYYLKKKKSKAIATKHVVKEGERLWDVAQEYAITIKSIKKMNRMRRFEGLEEGRVLWLKETRPEDVPVEYDQKPEPAKIKRITTPQIPKTQQEKQKDELFKIHEVQPKETLYRISVIYGVSVDDIKKWNNLTSNDLAVGAKLLIKK